MQPNIITVSEFYHMTRYIWTFSMHFCSEPFAVIIDGILIFWQSNFHLVDQSTCIGCSEMLVTSQRYNLFYCSKKAR